VKEHFKNRQKFEPDSTMPSYKFSKRESEAITGYLPALH